MTADDVFFLDFTEITTQALGGRPTCERSSRRRDEYRPELRRRHIPRVLLSDGTEPEAAAAGASSDRALAGTPASAGVVTGIGPGRARPSQAAARARARSWSPRPPTLAGPVVPHRRWTGDGDGRGELARRRGGRGSTASRPSSASPGAIDMITTGHAAHRRRRQRCGAVTGRRAGSGVPGPVTSALARSRDDRRAPATPATSCLPRPAAHFTERAMTAASLRHIAGDAGVDQAMVRHFFTDKAGLFRAAMQLPIDPQAIFPDCWPRGVRGSASDCCAGSWANGTRPASTARW